MRGVYTAVIKITGLAAAKTLLYLTAPANKVVEVLSASVTNSGSNVTNQQLELTLQKVNVLGSPTASTLTPSPHEQGDQASGSTVKGNVTASEPSYVANTDLGHEGSSSLAGWFFQPLPEERAYIAGGDTWGLRMLSTPTAYDANVRFTYREIG
jgi:hypothetical protein